MRQRQQRTHIVTAIGTEPHITKDERTVYFFALRYALPRQTYALSIISEQIMARITEFETWEVKDMIRECGYLYPSTEIDQEVADRFKEQLQSELERRKSDGEISCHSDNTSKMR